MKRLVSILLLVVAACGPSSSPNLTMTGSRPIAISVGGQPRIYYAYRPANLGGSQEVPLVIALHGYTEPATDLEHGTKFNDGADHAGFEVVYPQGEQNSWNAGTCCGDAQSRHIDDVAFIRELIDHLIASGGIDPGRVFVTGLSNGGMMAYRLACELSDRILAIASVSGTMAIPESDCHPAHPVSIFEMHGAADDVVPAGGGSGFPALSDVMSDWAANDQCNANKTTSNVGVTTTEVWGSCSAGSTVWLVSITGAGHTWFGSATSVIWDFFSHVPSQT